MAVQFTNVSTKQPLELNLKEDLFGSSATLKLGHQQVAFISRDSRWFGVSRKVSIGQHGY